MFHSAVPGSSRLKGCQRLSSVLAILYLCPVKFPSAGLLTAACVSVISLRVGPVVALAGPLCLGGTHLQTLDPKARLLSMIISTSSRNCGAT